MDASATFVLMLDKAILAEPEAFKGFDRTKNVQDQLQEMLCHGWGLQTICITLAEFSESPEGVPITISGSMEQLWLAFVMYQKGKPWNGEDWVAA